MTIYISRNFKIRRHLFISFKIQSFADEAGITLQDCDIGDGTWTPCPAQTIWPTSHPNHTFAVDLDAGGAWILSLFPENHIQRFTSSFHLFRFPCQCLNMRVKRRNFLNKVFPPVPSWAHELDLIEADDYEVSVCWLFSAWSEYEVLSSPGSP